MRENLFVHCGWHAWWQKDVALIIKNSTFWKHLKLAARCELKKSYVGRSGPDPFDLKGHKLQIFPNFSPKNSTSVDLHLLRCYPPLCVHWKYKDLMTLFLSKSKRWQRKVMGLLWFCRKCNGLGVVYLILECNRNDTLVVTESLYLLWKNHFSGSNMCRWCLEVDSYLSIVD